MTDANLQLMLALRAHLLADAGLAALVAARIHDGPPRNPAPPYVTLDDMVSEDQSGTDMVLELHRPVIKAVSRAGGRTEAMEIVAAIGAALAVPFSPAGYRVALLETEAIEIRLMRDRVTAEATIRLKILTEPA